MEKNGAKYGRQLQTKSPRFPSSFPPHPQEGAPFLKEGGWRASWVLINDKEVLFWRWLVLCSLEL